MSNRHIFTYQDIVKQVHNSMQKHLEIYLQIYAESILRDICRNEIELLLLDHKLPEKLQCIEEDHHNTFNLNIPLNSTLETILNEEYGISLDIFLPLTEKQKQQIDDKKKGIVRDSDGMIDRTKTLERQYKRSTQPTHLKRQTLYDLIMGPKHLDIREKRHLPGMNEKNSIDHQIILE